MTDIKPDRIFVKFRDYSLIESRYLADAPVPQQNRSEERYTVIPSTPLRRYYFNEDDKARVSEIDIALGDWGVSSWTDPHLSENIQPVALRAPEVLIHAPGTQAPTFGTSTPSCLNCIAQSACSAVQFPQVGIMRSKNTWRRL
jgi:serine/threonine-protein kinase SRPK3